MPKNRMETGKSGLPIAAVGILAAGVMIRSLHGSSAEADPNHSTPSTPSTGVHTTVGNKPAHTTHTPKHHKSETIQQAASVPIPGKHPHGLYKLNGKQLKLISEIESSPSAHKNHHNQIFVAKVLPIIMQDVLDGYHMNPEVVMDEAIIEGGSNGEWGNSEIVRNANNLFGAKPSVGWPRNKVYYAYGSEQASNGSYSSGDYAWKKFPNFAASVADYGIVIGTNDFYNDSERCDQSPKHFLQGLEYKLGPDCEPLPGPGGREQKPGDFQMAYATSQTYVHNTLAVGREYGISEIIAAGQKVPIEPGTN